MVEKTCAFESSGRISSSVGSWYISLFRALFSACGSMQILRSPFFFRATTTLLTQSISSSTCAITFIVCSLLSSIFRGSRRATGTRRVAATTGVMQLSILKCATPGKKTYPVHHQNCPAPKCLQGSRFVSDCPCLW